MTSLMPLLSSNSNIVSSPPVSSKKAPKKLRRKNPPPSLSISHQKLPSSAGSSTYDLSKSRPSSSKSSRSLNNGNGWFASPPTPHPTSTKGRRKSEPPVDLSPEEFPFRPPPLPILKNGDPGSPGLVRRNLQEPQEQPHHPSLPGSSAYSSPLALSKQGNSQIKQTILSSPPKMTRGKGRDALKAFSYDSYSNIPVSPPPQSPPPNSIPPTYLGTAQYPNNLIQQPATPKRGSFPTPLNTNLSPPTPAQLNLMGRTPNGSPILPPLPSFQSGGFGFDLSNTDTNDRFAKPKASPTYPGRQRYQPMSTLLSTPEAPSVLQRRRPTVFIEPVTQPPVPDSPLVDSPLVQSPGDYIFHALTAEEPIILPSSAEQSPESSPTANTESSQPPKSRSRRKSDAVSSFLGGWKLAMMSGSNPAATTNNDKVVCASESDAPPVGVGDGGGWIHRRKGSFSSTRPPSREKSKRNTYAQEYKEFRAQKQTASLSSSKGSSSPSSKEGSPSNSPVDGTGASAVLGDLSTRERYGERVKTTEARQTKREGDGEIKAKAQPVHVHLVDIEPVGAEPSEVVGLDVAVRQMKLLEDQLKKRRPLSPPDSRDGEKSAPIGASESDKGYRAGSEYSLTNTTVSTPQNSRQSSVQSSESSSPAGSMNQKIQLHPAPRLPPAKQKTAESMGKGKSRSPLRNEIDSDSVPSDSKDKKREHPKSSRHSANSAPAPPSSEYLGKPKGSNTGLESTPESGSRPPTPPKPIAKLFVICCRCKYWHDLPSVMYRGMVENGGATRCPYCLHGMEASCCSGYTCVVYMHQKHHGPSLT